MMGLMVNGGRGVLVWYMYACCTHTCTVQYHVFYYYFFLVDHTYIA